MNEQKIQVEMLETTRWSVMINKSIGNGRLKQVRMSSSQMAGGQT
jgi:hypothetical protein